MIFEKQPNSFYLLFAFSHIYYSYIHNILFRYSLKRTRVIIIMNGSYSLSDILQNKLKIYLQLWKI